MFLVCFLLEDISAKTKIWKWFWFHFSLNLNLKNNQQDKRSENSFRRSFRTLHQTEEPGICVNICMLIPLRSVITATEASWSDPCRGSICYRSVCCSGETVLKHVSSDDPHPGWRFLRMFSTRRKTTRLTEILWRIWGNLRKHSKTKQYLVTSDSEWKQSVWSVMIKPWMWNPSLGCFVH